MGPCRILVGIGCSSGLGFEAIKQFLAAQPQRSVWRIYISARSATSGQQAVANLRQSTATPSQSIDIAWLPLDLAQFPTSITQFSIELEQKLDGDTIDCLLLNAGLFSSQQIKKSAGGWSQEAIVNHFAQHLLVDYLRDSLTPPGNGTLPRLIYVSSSLQDRIKSATELTSILNGSNPTSTPLDRYAASKLAHAVAATYWKRALLNQADVLAVSPGFVPTTALNRDGPIWQRWFMRYVLSWAPFATSLHDGAASILQALNPPPETHDLLVQSRDDDKVLYLGVKGETRQLNPLTLDTEIQREWCPSREEMESWK